MSKRKKTTRNVLITKLLISKIMLLKEWKPLNLCNLNLEKKLKRRIKKTSNLKPKPVNLNITLSNVNRLKVLNPILPVTLIQTPVKRQKM